MLPWQNENKNAAPNPLKNKEFGARSGGSGMGNRFVPLPSCFLPLFSWRLPETGRRMEEGGSQGEGGISGDVESQKEGGDLGWG